MGLRIGLAFVLLTSACSDHAPRRDDVFGTAPVDDDDDDDDDDVPASGSDDGNDTGSGGGESTEGSTSTAATAASSEGSEAASTESGAPDGSSLDPPAGGSSGGSGGGPADAELRETGTGVFYRMIAPADPGPLPLLLVYSGTEGSQPMSINLLNFRGVTGTEGFAIAVLHGVEYYADPQAGVDVLEVVRADYDIDNDRMYLLSESAGTLAGLQLGLELRQSWFAAYWANDVNASATPTMTTDELGFRPWGNSGPGGQFQLADAIVGGMESAGYRTDGPSPYDGPGAQTHGDLDQLVAAVAWFPGKTRQ